MPKPATIRAIYRCLLRDARELQRTPHFCFRPALRLEEWGVGRFVEPTPPPSTTKLHAVEAPESSATIRSLDQFYRWRAQGFQDQHAPGAVIDVVGMVRAAFHENAGLTDHKLCEEKLNEAVSTMQELSEQLQLAKCSSVTVTDGVRVEVTSQYVKTHSKPKNNIFRFTYRVTITNQNESAAVQILGRQYTFESEKGQRIALPRNSPGIVGNTPVIAPGETFEYASGVDIDSPRGSVTGCLHALRKADNPDDEEPFDAFVSKFALLAPREAVHM